MDAPTRVDNDKGLTAMLYGVTNSLGNTYYGAETAYSARAGWNRTNAPIAFLLTARNLATAQAVVDRSVAADGTCPGGVFCLHGTGDSARNLRNSSYASVARLFSLFGRGGQVDVRTNTWMVPTTNVLGYMIGTAYLPTNFAAMPFAPGAVADHFTSCGGMLPDPCNNQSTVWDWMEYGASASYGTVAEPYAYTNKFPAPMVHFWMARGFTAGEALAMSVATPYQGIWAGDPLSAPFATPPLVSIDSPASNSVVDGTVVLEIAAEAHSQGASPAYVDLYVDGRLAAPILRPAAPAGNQLAVEVGTNRFSRLVARGESLAAAVAGLSRTINQEGGGIISATNCSDRLVVTTQQPLGPAAEPLEFSVETEQGAAQGLHIGAVAGTDHVVVEGALGRAAATFHLGDAPSLEIEHPVDLSALEPGAHVITVVVRDGSAVQCQAQADLPIIIPSRD
jgi:hypothetical protein